MEEEMRTVKVTLIKSAIGFKLNQKRTVEALGLRKLNSFKIHEENDAIKGMIFTIKHLVKVEEVEKVKPAAVKKAAKPVEAKTAKPKVEVKADVGAGSARPPETKVVKPKVDAAETKPKAAAKPKTAAAEAKPKAAAKPKTAAKPKADAAETKPKTTAKKAATVKQDGGKE